MGLIEEGDHIGSGASVFHIWHQDLVHMISHMKMDSATTYHILFNEFGVLPTELYALEPTIGFHQQFAHLTSSWLVSQAALFFLHLAEQGFDTSHQWTIMWKAS